MLALLRLRLVNRRSGVIGEDACSSVKTNADEQYHAGGERGDVNASPQPSVAARTKP